MAFDIRLQNPGTGFDIALYDPESSGGVSDLSINVYSSVEVSDSPALFYLERNIDVYDTSQISEDISIVLIPPDLNVPSGSESGGIKILNFDAGNLDDIDYIDTAGGTASVDASAHKGAYSAKIVPNGSSGSLALIEEFTNQTEVYARIYIKIPSTFRIPAWEGHGLFTLNANGQYDPVMVIGFGNNTGSEAFPDSIFFDGSDGWTWSMSTETIEADVWHCLELYWKKGTSGDGIGRAWFNGSQVREVTTLTNQARAGISGIYLGAWFGAGKYSSDDTVYFDSVKVDTSYIGLYPDSAVLSSSSVSESISIEITAGVPDDLNINVNDTVNTSDYIENNITIFVLPPGSGSLISAAGNISGSQDTSCYTTEAMSRLGNLITPSTNYEIGSVEFGIHSVYGSYSNIDWVVEIWEASVTYAYNLTTHIATTPSRKITGTGWTTFAFDSPVTLQSGTQYAILMRRADYGYDATNRVTLAYAGVNWSTGETSTGKAYNTSGVSTGNWSNDWPVRFNAVGENPIYDSSNVSDYVEAYIEVGPPDLDINIYDSVNVSDKVSCLLSSVPIIEIGTPVVETGGIFINDGDSNIAWSWGSLTRVEVPHKGTYSWMMHNTSVTNNSSTWYYFGGYTELYARFYVNLKDIGVNGTLASGRFNLASIGSDSVGEHVIIAVDVPNSSAPTQWMCRYQNGTVVSSSTNFSLTDWHCIELYSKPGSGNGTNRVWIDGALVFEKTDLTYTDNVDRLDIGIYSWGNFFEFGSKVYFDTIKVDSSYIGLLPDNPIYDSSNVSDFSAIDKSSNDIFIPSVSEQSNIAICDAESGDTSQFSSVSQPNGTFNVTSLEKFKGNYSYKLTLNGSDAGNTNANITFSNQTELYARVYFKLDSSFALPSSGSFPDIMRITGDYIKIGFRCESGTTNINTVHTNGTDGWVFGTFNVGNLKDGNWHSFEIYWKKGTSGDGIGRIWCDGNLLREVTNLSNEARTGVTNCVLGNYTGAGATVNTVYLDNLRIDSVAGGSYQENSIVDNIEVSDVPTVNVQATEDIIIPSTRESGGIFVIDAENGISDFTSNLQDEGCTFEAVREAKRFDNYGFKLGFTGQALNRNYRVKSFSEQSEVYARCYAYIPSTFQSVQAYGIIGLMNIRDGSSKLLNIEMRDDDGDNIPDVWRFYDGTSLDLSTNFSLDEWHCIELHWKAGTGSNGIFEIFVDGDLAYSRYDVAHSAYLADNLLVGNFGVHDGSYGSYYFIDQIKVDTSPIGPYEGYAIYDNASVSDDVSVQIEVIDELSVNIYDNVNVSESVSNYLDAEINVSDQIIISDINVCAISDIVIDIHDNVISIDFVVLAKDDYQISIFDLTNISDIIAIAKDDYSISIFDNINVSEVVSLVQSDKVIDINDSAIATDSVSAKNVTLLFSTTIASSTVTNAVLTIQDIALFNTTIVISSTTSSVLGLEIQFNAQVSETVSTIAVLSKTALLSTSIGLAVSTITSLHVDYTLVVLDNIVILDEVVGQAILEINAFDNSFISEQTVANSLLELFVADNIVCYDQVVIGQTLEIFIVDNISIKDNYDNLIDNGTFDTGLEHWEYSAPRWYWDETNQRMALNSGGVYFQDSFTNVDFLENGSIYRIEFDANVTSGGIATIFAGDTLEPFTATGHYNLIHTHNTAYEGFGFSAQIPGVAWFDNIIIKKIDNVQISQVIDVSDTGYISESISINVQSTETLSINVFDSVSASENNSQYIEDNDVHLSIDDVIVISEYILIDVLEVSALSINVFDTANISDNVVTTRPRIVLIDEFSQIHRNNIISGINIGYGSDISSEVEIITDGINSGYSYAANNENISIIIRCAIGVADFIDEAQALYPRVQTFFPLGSNNFEQLYVLERETPPVIITTGAGDFSNPTNDRNNTGYGNGLEFWDRDLTISDTDDESSYANGVVLGKILYIRDSLNCSWWEARYRARETAYRDEPNRVSSPWDLYNGYGRIDTTAAISWSGTIPDDYYLDFHIEKYDTAFVADYIDITANSDLEVISDVHVIDNVEIQLTDLEISVYDISVCADDINKYVSIDIIISDDVYSSDVFITDGTEPAAVLYEYAFVSENIAITVSDINLSVFDTIVTEDVPSLVFEVDISAYDNVVVGEIIDTVIEFSGILIYDNAVGTDIITMVISDANIDVSDSSVVTDYNYLETSVLSIDVQDSVNISDIASLTYDTSTAIIIDLTTTSDNVNVALDSLVVNIVDSINVDDYVNLTAPEISLEVSDTCSTSDIVSQTREIRFDSTISSIVSTIGNLTSLDNAMFNATISTTTAASGVLSRTIELSSTIECQVTTSSTITLTKRFFVVANTVSSTNAALSVDFNINIIDNASVADFIEPELSQAIEVYDNIVADASLEELAQVHDINGEPLFDINGEPIIAPTGDFTVKVLTDVYNYDDVNVTENLSFSREQSFSSTISCSVNAICSLGLDISFSSSIQCQTTTLGDIKRALIFQTGIAPSTTTLGSVGLTQKLEGPISSIVSTVAILSIYDVALFNANIVINSSTAGIQHRIQRFASSIAVRTLTTANIFEKTLKLNSNVSLSTVTLGSVKRIEVFNSSINASGATNAILTRVISYFSNIEASTVTSGNIKRNLRFDSNAICISDCFGQFGLTMQIRAGISGTTITSADLSKNILLGANIDLSTVGSGANVFCDIHFDSIIYCQLATVSDLYLAFVREFLASIDIVSAVSGELTVILKPWREILSIESKVIVELLLASDISVVPQFESIVLPELQLNSDVIIPEDLYLRSWVINNLRFESKVEDV